MYVFLLLALLCYGAGSLMEAFTPDETVVGDACAEEPR